MLSLLLTTVALLATPMAQSEAVADPAALLPANTLFYVGTPSLQAGAEMSRSSAMRKILDEPEMKAFLQKPVAAADKALQELIAQSGLPAEATPKVSLAGMMAGDSVPVGRVFVALTHVSLPAPGADGPGEPDVGLVVGVEMRNERDLGLVKALWSLIEMPESAATHGDRSYLVKKIPEGPTLALAFLDKLAVVTLSEKALRGVIDNAKGGTGTSLADTPEYKQVAALGGGLRPDSTTWMFRVAQVNDMLRGLLTMVMMMEQDNEELPKLSAILDQVGLKAVHWVGGEGHREADGRVVGTMGVSTAKDATGLIGRLLASEVPVDLGLVSGVPGNCLSMTAMGIDWLPHLYDFAVSAFQTLAPEEASAVLAQVDAFLGESSLRDDVLANMHGVALTYAMPGEGFPGTPASIVRIQLRDPQRFVTAIEAAVTAVSSAFEEVRGLKLTKSEHEGRPFYELDVSSTPAQMLMWSPAFAIDGNTIVGSLESPKAVRTALNGVQGTGSLADNSEFMAFAKGLAAKGTVTSLSFSDNAKVFGAMYGQIAPAVGMMGPMLGDLPVDFSLMPTEPAITRHLGYSYGGGYSTPGGLAVERSVSEFTLGDFVPLVLTGGVIGAQVALGGVSSEPEPAPEISAEERVQADLQQLSAAMTVYRISQGGYPTALADLVKPLPDYEEGCLGKPDLPVDPWGNGYHFRLNEKKKPFLWSAGPNGMDEGGAGDDIAKK